ncbi:unnamed protein product, partial [Rotaria sp. Silwood2]
MSAAPRLLKPASTNTSEECKILDNQSELSPTDIKPPYLINSEPFSIAKQLISKTENSLYSSQRESLNSTTSEKITLMTAFEQSSVVQPLLTDLYQISMAYAYWKANKHQEMATFDLYFRKNPFGGEYTLFAGLDECLKFIRDYKFHQTDIDYLRSVLPTYTEPEYFDYLLQLDMNDIKIFAVPE